MLPERYKLNKRFSISLNDIMEVLDHSYLNDLEPFRTENPTSENIAKFIYKEMEKKIKVKGCKIGEVEVWESERSSMIYYE